MKGPPFYIYSGAPGEDAFWLETLEDLSSASERLDQIAAQKPGTYFIFSIQANAIVAWTNIPERPAVRSELESNAQGG